MISLESRSDINAPASRKSIFLSGPLFWRFFAPRHAVKTVYAAVPVKETIQPFAEPRSGTKIIRRASPLDSPQPHRSRWRSLRSSGSVAALPRV